MKKWILFYSLIGILGQASFAKANTGLCICEIGNKIKSEMKWYRSGCNIWIDRMIKENKCSSVDYVIRERNPYSFSVPSEDPNRNIFLGFVGHWSSSTATKEEVTNRLLPVIQKTGQNLFYDNTACNGSSDTQDLQSFMLMTVKPQLKKFQSLTIKANQVISVGIWDYVLGNSVNMFSFVSTDFKQAIYPECQTFAGNYCVGSGTRSASILGGGQVQEGTTGFCRQDRQLIQLMCQTNKWVPTGKILTERY